MSKLISVLFCIFQFGVCWATELEIPTKRIVTNIPIGNTTGALSYKGSDPYEPESPSHIQIHQSSEDFYIVDFYQGVIRYDSNFNYRETLHVLACDRITLTENLIVAWFTGSENTTVTAWNIQDGVIGKSVSAVLSGTGRRQLFSRGKYIFYAYLSGNPFGFIFQDNELEPIPENEMNQAFENVDLKFNAGNIYDNNLGVITDRSERFFRLAGAPELLYAKTKKGQDSVNIARGNIFGIDSLKRRYIFYHGEGKARIAIAESNGNLIKVFDIIAGGDTDVKLSLPCLAPNGSVYYIESNSDGHRVIEIPMQW